MARTLTDAQWRTLSGAVALAEDDWRQLGGQYFASEVRTLNRAWQRLVEARKAGQI